MQVYFRVSNVFKDVNLQICRGAEVIFSKKKKKMAPGEMESILIKKEWMDGAKELTLKLEGY